jgi:hypothetical protein
MGDRLESNRGIIYPYLVKAIKTEWARYCKVSVFRWRTTILPYEDIICVVHSRLRVLVDRWSMIPQASSWSWRLWQEPSHHSSQDMSLPDNSTVLIVGAGPAGLTAALSLIQYGCRETTSSSLMSQSEDRKNHGLLLYTLQPSERYATTWAFIEKLSNDFMIIDFSQYQCSRCHIISSY